MRERLGATAPQSHEEIEKLVVTKVYEMTHPDFDSTWYGNGRTRPRHRELLGLWKKKIDEIALEPAAIFFYVSMFSRKDFQDLARKKYGRTPRTLWAGQTSAIVGDSMQRDLERIFYAKEKLGRRFLLLLSESGAFTEVKHEQVRVKKILDAKAIEIPPDLPIHCFGEYLEQCVGTEARNLALILGRPVADAESGRYMRKVPELSLSAVDPETFLQFSPN